MLEYTGEYSRIDELRGFFFEYSFSVLLDFRETAGVGLSKKVHCMN